MPYSNPDQFFIPRRPEQAQAQAHSNPSFIMPIQHETFTLHYRLDTVKTARAAVSHCFGKKKVPFHVIVQMLDRIEIAVRVLPEPNGEAAALQGWCLIRNRPRVG